MPGHYSVESLVHIHNNKLKQTITLVPICTISLIFIPFKDIYTHSGRKIRVSITNSNIHPAVRDIQKIRFDLLAIVRLFS